MINPNLTSVWVKILRSLRETKNFALFGLLSSLDDVEFFDGKILIHTHNAAEKLLISQHLPALQNLAGDTVLTLQDDTVTVQANNYDTIARLKELFGDKVEIV